MRPEGYGVRHSISGDGVFNGPHIPKRLRSLLRKGTSVQAGEVIFRGVAHGVQFLPWADENGELIFLGA